MPEFIYHSVAGRVHASLRERSPQSVAALAKWLKQPASKVSAAISGDDRMGWRGYPVSDPGGVVVSLVTKEACLPLLLPLA